jgi:hypothetical protein
MKIIKTYNQITESHKHKHKENIELLTQDQIDWCDNHLTFSDWEVTKDGTIEYSTAGGMHSLVWLKGNFKSMPVKFEPCTSFKIEDNEDLEDLTGCPDEVLTTYSLTNCPNLKSLVGGPTKAGRVMIENCGIKDMKGCPTEGTELYLVTKCKDLESIMGIPHRFNPDKIFVSQNKTDFDKLKDDFARGYTDEDYEDYEKEWTF